MKPIGLEGKVGAPAIVRTNPLRAPFAAYVEYCNDAGYFNTTVASKFLAPVAFTWPDVLDLIQERYPASTIDTFFRWRLEEFASCATNFLPDRLLRYDLDTPELQMTFGRIPFWDDSYVLTPKIVVLTGALRHFHIVGNNTCGIADGPILTGRAEYSLLVVRSSVSSLDVSDGVLVHAPLPDSLHCGYSFGSNSLLISGSSGSSCCLGSHSGVACGPESHPDARAIYGWALSLADHPLDLLAVSSDIRKEARHFLKKMERQRNDR